MGMLENVSKESAAGDGGDYLKEGKHVAVIESVKLIETPLNGEAVVVEVRITESTTEEVDAVKTIMYLDKYVAAKRSFKKFVMDVTDCNEAEAGDLEVLQGIVGNEQQLKGIAVEIQSYIITTKGNQKPFTKHNWSRVA